MIRVSNREKTEIEWEEGLTVFDLLERLDYLTSPHIIVSINGEIVPLKEYATRTIPDGADVRIVYQIAGGEAQDMKFPDFGLGDQKAIVTGSSKGIGRGIALALANAGADVVVTSRALERAEPVATEIQQMGREALPLALEVASLESIDAMVEAVLDRFGRIDILVNNAGINIPEPAVEVTQQHWDSVLDTNLKGLFFCSQQIGKVMLDQGRGKIINIASQMGLVGGELRAAYCSSKGGVVQLTKVLAIEWSRQGVNVNAVAPTFIRTPLTEPMFEDEAFYQEVLSNIPLGRIGEVEDVVGAVIFLASSAADLITGHTLLVDGGWTAW